MASIAFETQLTSLPLELVRKIAALCPLSDLIALSRTCRYLYNTCTDMVVLQECFMNNMIRPTAQSRNMIRGLVRADLASKDPRLAKPILISLIAATSQLPSLIEELQTLLEHYKSVPWDYSWDSSAPEPGRLPQTVKNIVGALSTLTVLGYPTTNDFTIPAALTGLAARLFEPYFWEGLESSPEARLSLGSQISFCLAAGVLGRRVLNNMPLLSLRVASIFERPDGSLLLHDLNSSFEGRQTTALLIIACLPWVLESDPYVRIHVRDHLPHPTALPLLANVLGRGGHIPLPDGELAPGGETCGNVVVTAAATRSLRRFGFAPSWQKWLRSNVDVLIDEIGSGEWVGYYTNTRGRESQVDQPLGNIHFVTRPGPLEDDSVILTAEDCVDGAGAFRLDGKVYRATGLVSLVKQYVAGHSWTNTGTITPLGIAGTWGDEQDSAKGFLWMYKKEWTRRGAAQMV